MPADFWRATPRFVALTFEGRGRALTREHGERQLLAWQIEAFARTQRLPDPRTLIADRAPMREQTEAEQRAIFRALSRGATQH